MSDFLDELRKRYPEVVVKISGETEPRDRILEAMELNEINKTEYLLHMYSKLLEHAAGDVEILSKESDQIATVANECVEEITRLNEEVENHDEVLLENMKLRTELFELQAKSEILGQALTQVRAKRTKDRKHNQVLKEKLACAHRRSNHVHRALARLMEILASAEDEVDSSKYREMAREAFMYLKLQSKA